MSACRGLVYLMYHEIEMPGRPMCQGEDPGYVRYVLREVDFRNQMQDLRARRLRGMSVGEALSSAPKEGVVLTFDDGCETDLIAVAPVLKELSFGATFYITAGTLGRPGYLSRAQLRDLAELGFEVGSHSMTHPYLSDLSEPDLKREIEQSRLLLREITNCPVLHFSCPGGRYDQRVVTIARTAGYLSVATSQTRANTPLTDSYALGRVAILRGTSLKEFRRITDGQGLWKRRAQDSGRAFIRNLVGNSLYDRVRGRLLGRG